MRDLELGLIGNCAFAALVDERAEMVWACLPRFDPSGIIRFCVMWLLSACRPAIEMVVDGLRPRHSRRYRDAPSSPTVSPTRIRASPAFIELKSARWA